jgi:hypothetical protein
MARLGGQGSDQGLYGCGPAVLSARVDTRAKPVAGYREFAMIRRHRNRLVEVRADLVLADEATAAAYAVHFEAQMHRSVARKLLTTNYLRFACRGVAMFNLTAMGMGWLPTDLDA